MANTASLVWLASYPKSGSTWVRSLLTAYLSPDTPLDINDLVATQDPFDRQLLDDHAAISSAEFRPDELIPYQAELHKAFAAGSARPSFIKTHSAYQTSADGIALFPASVSAGVIYIARNPMDVVPSYAHHEGRDLDWTIARLADSEAGIDKWRNRASTMLTQEMGSWSENVDSWLTQTAIPLLLLRYEDIHRDPESCLTKILQFSGIEAEPKLVTQAVEACQISRLREAESRDGFSERPSPKREFFRAGRIGDGARDLTSAQKATILRDHSTVMAKLNYPVAIEDYETAVSKRI